MHQELVHVVGEHTPGRHTQNEFDGVELHGLQGRHVDILGALDNPAQNNVKVASIDRILTLGGQ